jgi:hypothetical protein
VPVATAPVWVLATCTTAPAATIVWSAALAAILAVVTLLSAILAVVTFASVILTVVTAPSFNFAVVIAASVITSVVIVVTALGYSTIPLSLVSPLPPYVRRGQVVYARHPKPTC